jgi:hypothetical protein
MECQHLVGLLCSLTVATFDTNAIFVRYCKLFTDSEAFRKHAYTVVMTEPFMAGPWAGKLPSEVAEMMPELSCYSSRQFSLRDYVALLSSEEQKQAKEVRYSFL